MCLAILQVYLAGKKICPWTAVQQDTQRLRKARGLGVLQSVSLTEINWGGSAPASRGPSSPCVKAAGLREKPNASDTSQGLHTADGRACSRDGNFLILLFSDDKMKQCYRKHGKKNINHTFDHPNKSVFISRVPFQTFLSLIPILCCGRELRKHTTYWVSSWTLWLTFIIKFISHKSPPKSIGRVSPILQMSI